MPRHDSASARLGCGVGCLVIVLALVIVTLLWRGYEYAFVGPEYSAPKPTIPYKVISRDFRVDRFGNMVKGILDVHIVAPEETTVDQVREILHYEYKQIKWQDRENKNYDQMAIYVWKDYEQRLLFGSLVLLDLNGQPVISLNERAFTSRPQDQPGTQSEAQSTSGKKTWKALEPGLKLTYRDQKTGREIWVERCAPCTLSGYNVIPVVAEDEEYVSYLAEQDGWLVEIGARDPNGRAAWPEPIPCYPLKPTAGTEWEGGDESTILHHEIEAIEEISVPAGKFRTARVVVKALDLASRKEEADSEQRFWYDVETGIVVKSGDLVLVKEEKVEPRPDPGELR